MGIGTNNESRHRRACGAGVLGNQRPTPNAQRSTLNDRTSAGSRCYEGAIAVGGEVLTDDEHAPEIIETLDKSSLESAKNLMNRLVTRAQVETVLTASAQLRINKSVQRIETKVSEAVGELVCRVHINAFIWNRNVHGNRCFFDPDFLKWFKKEEPGAFFNLRLRRYVNGWRAPGEETRNVDPSTPLRCAQDDKLMSSQ